MPDKDVIKGKAKKGRGLIKEAAGDANGKLTDKLAGKTDQAVGKVQEAVGHAKDAVKDAAAKRH
jgi:uncharacterized protein YjbJ (UPF0337 family)